MNWQGLKIIAILLTVFLLSACGDACVRACDSQGKECERECGAGHCVDADDWGYPKLFVPATSNGNTLRGGILSQYAAGIDSGLVIINAEETPLIITVSRKDQWTSWFGGDINPGSDEGRPDPNGFDAGRTVPDVECNYVLEQGHGPSSAASTFKNDLSPQVLKANTNTVCSTLTKPLWVSAPSPGALNTANTSAPNKLNMPDTYADCMVPCYIRNGMGLYIGLAPNNGSASVPDDVVLAYHIPDAKIPDGRSKDTPLPPVGGETDTQKAAREKLNRDNLRESEARDGYLVNGLPKIELDGAQTGDRLYFKIVDRTYIDNSGGYHVKIKGGARGAEAGVLEKIASIFIDPMKVAMNRLYNGIRSNEEYINAVRALLVLYMIFFGYTMMIGGLDDIKQSAGIRLFKVAIILQLISPSSWNFFYNHLFGAFMGGIQSFAGLLMNPFGDYDPNNPWYSMDQMLHKFWSGETWSKILSTFFSNSLGFLFIPAMFLSIGILTVALFKALVVYLLAFGCIAILIVVAPIFIVFMLFEKTKGLTNEWFNQMAVFAIQQVVLMAALGMFAAIILSIMERTIGYNVCWNIWSRFGFAGFNIFDFKFWMPDIGNDMVNILINTHEIDADGNTIKETITRYIDMPYLDPIYDKDQIANIKSEKNFIVIGDILLLVGAVFMMQNFMKIVPTIASTLKSGSSKDSADMFGGGASLLGSFASAAMPILGGIKNTAVGAYSLAQNAEAQYAARSVKKAGRAAISTAGGAAGRAAGFVSGKANFVSGKVVNSSFGKAVSSAAGSAKSSVANEFNRQLNTKANQASLKRLNDKAASFGRGMDNVSSSVSARVASVQASVASAKKSALEVRDALKAVPGALKDEVGRSAANALSLPSSEAGKAYAAKRDAAMADSLSSQAKTAAENQTYNDVAGGLSRLNRVLGGEGRVAQAQAKLWASGTLSKSLDALPDMKPDYQKDVSLKVLQALGHDDVAGVAGLRPTAEAVIILEKEFMAAQAAGMLTDDAQIAAINKNLNILAGNVHEGRHGVDGVQSYDAAVAATLSVDPVTGAALLPSGDTASTASLIEAAANANLALEAGGTATSPLDLGGRSELSGVQEYYSPTDSSFAQVEVPASLTTAVVDDVATPVTLLASVDPLMPVTKLGFVETPDAVEQQEALLAAAEVLKKAQEQGQGFVVEPGASRVDGDASDGLAVRESALDEQKLSNFAAPEHVVEELPVVVAEAANITLAEPEVVPTVAPTEEVASVAGDPLIPVTSLGFETTPTEQEALIAALNADAALHPAHHEVVEPGTVRGDGGVVDGLDDRREALVEGQKDSFAAAPAVEAVEVEQVKTLSDDAEVRRILDELYADDVRSATAAATLAADEYRAVLDNYQSVAVSLEEAAMAAEVARIAGDEVAMLAANQALDASIADALAAQQALEEANWRSIYAAEETLKTVEAAMLEEVRAAMQAEAALSAVDTELALRDGGALVEVAIEQPTGFDVPIEAPATPLADLHESNIVGGDTLEVGSKTDLGEANPLVLGATYFEQPDVEQVVVDPLAEAAEHSEQVKALDTIKSLVETIPQYMEAQAAMEKAINAAKTAEKDMTGNVAKLTSVSEEQAEHVRHIEAKLEKLMGDKRKFEMKKK